MNGVETNDIAVMRAEVNGKLDLLLERTSNLKDGQTDHEHRIRDLEEHGSPTAAAAVTSLSRVEAKVNKIGVKVAAAFGGLAVVVFTANIGVAKGWF